MFLHTLQIKKEKSLSPYKSDQEPFSFLPVLPRQNLPLSSCPVPHSPVEQDAPLEAPGMAQDSILWWRTIPPQTLNKCKVVVMRRRGRQKIICLCINPCQDFAHKWLTCHASAVTLLPSCDPWAGGCGSLSETSSQYQSWAHHGFSALFLWHPALSAWFPTSSIGNILVLVLLSLWSLQETSEWRREVLSFFPQKYLLTGHGIFQRLQKLDMGGQVHMKRQKGHLPVYYSHKHPTKTLVLHEKQSVAALWVSRLSVSISSLLTWLI